jgi:RNA polymerase sigma factor (TIGR02999 family)
MLLKAWGNGDQAALDRLTHWSTLSSMARRHMRKERENTLQTTALVHEAYLRLVEGLACKDRTHFFALSAQIMRRILVDAARLQARGRCPGARPYEQVRLNSCNRRAIRVRLSG